MLIQGLKGKKLRSSSLIENRRAFHIELPKFENNFFLPVEKTKINKQTVFETPGNQNSGKKRRL